jgi:hypothetical protein
MYKKQSSSPIPITEGYRLMAERTRDASQAQTLPAAESIRRWRHARAAERPGLLLDIQRAFGNQYARSQAQAQPEVSEPCDAHEKKVSSGVTDARIPFNLTIKIVDYNPQPPVKTRRLKQKR